MKAIALKKYLPVSDPDCLFMTEQESPKASGHDVLVEVRAVSVNPVDTKLRAPKQEVEEDAKVLGFDACGVIVECGESVSLFKPGDRVFYAGDVTRPGCNSQFHLVDERIVGRAPASFSDEECAAMPLTAITAWESLFERMAIDPVADNSNKSILVIGGAGGVGSIATQLASRVAGLKVIATASRRETQVWCEQQGADDVVNHHRELESQLSEIGVSHVDYILCCNSTDTHFDAMAELIAPQGSICCIVDSAAALNMNALKAKSAGFVWEFMFTKAKYQTPDMISQHHILNEVARLCDQGVLTSTLNKTLRPINAENMIAAHGEIEAGQMIGKLVLSAWSD